MSDIKQILSQRAKTHGNYLNHAQTSQCLKSVMRNSVNWADLLPSQTEALEMIAHKIARILSGDPSHIDHWDDISGYATLVAQEMRRKQNGEA